MHWHTRPNRRRKRNTNILGLLPHRNRSRYWRSHLKVGSRNSPGLLSGSPKTRKEHVYNHNYRRGTLPVRHLSLKNTRPETAASVEGPGQAWSKRKEMSKRAFLSYNDAPGHRCIRPRGRFVRLRDMPGLVQRSGHVGLRSLILW